MLFNVLKLKQESGRAHETHLANEKALRGDPPGLWHLPGIPPGGLDNPRGPSWHNSGTDSGSQEGFGRVLGNIADSQERFMVPAGFSGGASGCLRAALGKRGGTHGTPGTPLMYIHDMAPKTRKNAPRAHPREVKALSPGPQT